MNNTPDRDLDLPEAEILNEPDPDDYEAREEWIKGRIKDASTYNDLRDVLREIAK